MIGTNQVLDCLIVGQGLAGTLLAHTLERQGYSFHILDNDHHGGCSKIAAGVMNPITGRRFVKSWMYDELYPVAWDTYREIEGILDCEIIQARNVLRVLQGPGQETEWLARSGWPENQKYIVDEPDPGIFSRIGHKNWKYGEVQYSYQVDIPLLIEKSKAKWLSMEKLTLQAFSYDDLRVDQLLYYQDLIAKNIVFCEGQQVRRNPFFGKELLAVSRGDILLVQIADFPLRKMVKKKYFLIHLQDDLFWFGALNSWDDTDEPLQDSARQELANQLGRMINIPFEVVAHKAAIRPTVQDRRPILGRHPSIANMYIFNGLGTKGSSLGPFWVEKLVKQMFKDHALPKIVDVQRFYS